MRRTWVSGSDVLYIAQCLIKLKHWSVVLWSYPAKSLRSRRRTTGRWLVMVGFGSVARNFLTLLNGPCWLAVLQSLPSMSRRAMSYVDVVVMKQWPAVQWATPRGPLEWLLLKSFISVPGDSKADGLGLASSRRVYEKSFAFHSLCLPSDNGRIAM
jgi:hypothetical protein